MTEDKPFEPVVLSNTRTDDLGRVATRMLFKQYNPNGTEDIHVWRQVFVETLDPTEYSGAIALVGSWENWEKFKRNWPSFQRTHLDAWLEEIEIKLKSIAIRSLVIEAKSGKNSSAASKFLAEGRYKDKKAGRPTKDAVLRQTRIDAQVEREIANDLERLGL